MNSKIKIVLVIIIAAGMLFLGYKLRNRDGVITPINTTDSNDGYVTGGDSDNAAPRNEIGKIKPIIDEFVFDYFIVENGLLAINKEGKLISITKGEKKTVSSEDFEDVEEAIFSHDGKFVLLKAGGAYKSYNISRASWRDLGELNSASWSPNNHDIAYISSGILNILNLDSIGSRPRQISKIDFEDASLSWIDSGNLAISERGGSFYKSSIWKVNIQNKVWEPLVYEKAGLSSYFIGSEKLGLILTSLGRGGVLTLVRSSGESVVDMEFLTMPQKCLIKDTSLICAIPQESAFTQSFLPDAYLKQTVFTSDYFADISLSSGEILAKNVPTQSFDAHNLKLNGDNLYFKNRADNFVYSVVLKK